MKTFEQGNWSNGNKCPFCGKGGEGEIVLVPISGTQEGNIVEAIQIHTKCIQDRWIYDKEHNAIVARGEFKYL